MTTLFLAWRSPQTRSWYTIGRLTADGTYRFVYTGGVKRAEAEGGFTPLAEFPERERIYESDELFPIFANRLLPHSRPEYRHWVEWTSLPQHHDDPIALLARSGGRRATDSFEVFPRPEQEEDGSYHVHFFAHGLRYFPAASAERAVALRPGDPLLLMQDFQNPADPQALMLRTVGDDRGDIHGLGFCPRYLLHDVLRLLEKNPQAAEVKVERVNPPPAPLQFRLLCSLTLPWREGFEPFSDEAHQPIPTDADVIAA